MPQDEITGPEQTDRSIVDKLWSKRAELLWGLVTAVVLFSVVDPVLLIGTALAIATAVAAWAGVRELLDRAEEDDAKPAATSLRPAPTDRSEPAKTATQLPQQRRNAA